MPVFHTKTIESVLEPIAQQISKLVILHEEADNGNQMPDLSVPLQVLQSAVENLIKVGTETSKITEDSLLKKELPQALSQVKDACESLEKAAIIFKSDSESPVGKRKLVEGQRGILQGISDILIALDESQVRRIENSCKHVIEYLSITELIEKTDDLVTYMKNLTPILAKMTREVDSRQKELTDLNIRERLCENLDQVKTLIPSFVSSIKVVLILNHSADVIDQHLIHLANENKDFMIKRLTDEINEIIKTIKKTTDNEDYLFFEDFNKNIIEMKNFELNCENLIKWLSTENSVIDYQVEDTINEALKNCDFFLSKYGQNEDKKLFNLFKNCESLLINLLTSDKNQKNEISPSSANILSDQLNEIMGCFNKAYFEPGYNYLCLSFYDQLELSAKWLRNSNGHYSLIGEMSARSIIQEAKNIMSKEVHFNDRQNFEKFILESEFMIDNFINLSNQNILDRVAIKNTAKQLYSSLNFIVKRIYRLLIEKIVNQYSDINEPLNKLSEIIKISNGDNIDQEKFNEASLNFLDKCEKLCQNSAALVLSTNQIKTRNPIDLINKLTTRIKEISPQIVNAGYLSIKCSGDKSFHENFEQLQQQWEKNIQALQKLIDENIDCESFIIACEKSIINETFETQNAVLEKNATVIINNTISIAQKANRIMKIIVQEGDNSEDKLFVEKILYSNDKLKQSLPFFVQSAKSLALDPSNKENYLTWASSNEQLIDAIAEVRESVSNSNSVGYSRSSIPNDQNLNDQLSQLDNLTINEDYIKYSYQNRYKSLPVSRPTPLPDLVEENENEFPEPQNNQPILMAAHDLHYSINQWYTTDNDIVTVAKRITFMMAKLSELVRRQNRSNIELISTAKQLFDDSLEFCRLAKLIADHCTDKRMKMNLLQVSERIPTIVTQLKILTTVKATMLGHQGTKEDEEATDMLIINAQNLNTSIKETIRAAKSATIKLKPNSPLKFKWVRKKSIETNLQVD